jgi:hypothetical protein
MRLTLILLLPLLCVASRSAFSQGSLTPPAGPPGPTMKTLDQLEAKLEKRTPVAALPFTISAAGSYYVTKNLSVKSGDGITIKADGVTLDLNGFSISSTANPAAGTAIFLSGNRRNVAIVNGHVTGTGVFNGSSFTGAGFKSGIARDLGSEASIQVRDVSVSGCASLGIEVGSGLGQNTIVERCQVDNCGGTAITAGMVSNSSVTQSALGITADSVSNCVAYGCGISSSGPVTNSSGSALGPGFTTGIEGGVVLNCQGVSGSGFGIYAHRVAMNCYALNTSTDHPALRVDGTANSCSAANGGGGLAIQASIGIGCTTLGGGTSITHKFLGTP